jgi:hypothetical protein
MRDQWLSHQSVQQAFAPVRSGLQDTGYSFQEKSVRSFLFAVALALVAAPLSTVHAQKRERYKIAAEELATFGDQNLADVLPKARPQFFEIGGAGGSTQSAAEGNDAGGRCADMTCNPVQLLVYVGTHREGDSTMLRYYKASDVKEVRFYKPNESMARVGADNAYVIQVIMKDPVAP